MLVLAALLSSDAHALPLVRSSIGAEYLVSFDVGEEGAESLGHGVGARFGLSLELLALTLTPEVGATVWLEDTRFVPEAGVRLQFAKLIEPGLYAHVLPSLREGGGVGWDGGVSLDLTAIPKIDVGVQAGALNLDNTFYVQAGLQVHVNLGSKK